MKLSVTGDTLIVEKSCPSERYNTESHLLYHIKKALNAAFGFDFIKKRMWKDGHMVAETQQYLRTRDWEYAIYDGKYAIRFAHKEFNQEGSVEYCLGQGEDW